jgi:hypothetical protein
VSNSEGIGTLKLQCPQSHPVGRLLRDAPHQSVLYDPGVVVGPRRFWPDEGDQPQFTTQCRFCEQAVGGTTSALQTQLSALFADPAATSETTTLSYV